MTTADGVCPLRRSAEMSHMAHATIATTLGGVHALRCDQKGFSVGRTTEGQASEAGWVS